MSKTHWLQNPNKNYLGNWDIPENKDLILTIDSAKWEDVKNPINGKKEQKRVIRFKEKVKPLICNQTNAKAVIKSTGCRYMEDSVGKKIALFVSVYFDKISKEDMDVVRVRSEPVKIANKPALLENTENFAKAKEALSNGYSIEDVKKKYTISPEIEKLLTNK